AYHSSFNEEPDVRQAGNMAILPIRTKIRGPAPIGCLAPSELHTSYIILYCIDSELPNIIDETLFRANSLFRNLEIDQRHCGQDLSAEIKGPVLTLIVLILYVSDCLAKLSAARTSLNTLSVDNFTIPRDANFALNAHYAVSANYSRQYLVQVCQELAARLVERLYADGTGKPNKWWMSFQTEKRRSMNRNLG
ncbi:actin-related protein 2/3 complex subunit 3, partial [Mycena haematopus]